MPMRTNLTGETVGMRLMNALLGGQIGPLARFIAKRRMPGEKWMSWADIAADLTRLTGETVTGPGVELWAGKYGIPRDTRPGDPPEARAAYLAAVARYGVTR